MVRCWGFTSILKFLKCGSTCKGRESSKKLPPCSSLFRCPPLSLGVRLLPQIYLPTQSPQKTMISNPHPHLQSLNLFSGCAVSKNVTSLLLHLYSPILKFRSFLLYSIFPDPFKKIRSSFTSVLKLFVNYSPCHTS